MSLINKDCSDEGLTLETSAKHHIPQATYMPYQPLLIKPIFTYKVSTLRRIQDSDKRPPTLSNCYCCLTSPFSQEKYGQNIYVCFTLGGSTKPPEPPLDPPQLLALSAQLQDKKQQPLKTLTSAAPQSLSAPFSTMQ